MTPIRIIHRTQNTSGRVVQFIYSALDNECRAVVVWDDGEITVEPLPHIKVNYEHFSTLANEPPE